MPLHPAIEESHGRSAPTDTHAAVDPRHLLRRLPRNHRLPRSAAPELSEPLLALAYGIAIIGAAFPLAWAAEAAQFDISAGLALAVLALLAVLLDRSLSVWGACGLLGLFAIQFFASIFLSTDAIRLVIEVLSAVYLLLAAVETFRRRSVAWQTLKDGLFTSFKKLEKQADAAEEAAQ